MKLAVVVAELGGLPWSSLRGMITNHSAIMLLLEPGAQLDLA